MSNSVFPLLVFLYVKFPLSPIHVATSPCLIFDKLFSLLFNHVIEPIVSGINKNLIE